MFRSSLLILRATELLAPGRSQDRATRLAVGLYVAYNVAATLASVPAGRLGDRRGAVLVLALGVGLFGLAYAGFAIGGASVLALMPWFLAAGVAIGCVETAEHAAVAALAPVELRGSAFGLLAAVQSFGNLANLKGRELANRCCADRAELIATAQVGSIRARRDPDLLRSFLAGTGLTI